MLLYSKVIFEIYNSKFIKNIIWYLNFMDSRKKKRCVKRNNLKEVGKIFRLFFPVISFYELLEKFKLLLLNYTNEIWKTVKYVNKNYQNAVKYVRKNLFLYIKRFMRIFLDYNCFSIVFFHIVLSQE